MPAFVPTASSPAPAAVPVPRGIVARSRGDSCLSAVTVFLHLAQQDILLCGVELVAPALLGAVALAERQLQRVTGLALCDIVVGVDIDPIIIFIGQDECTEGSIYIELRLYIKIELAVRFDDLVTEREISRGEMSRRGDLFTAQMIQQLALLIIARLELRPCGMVHRR